MIRDTMDVVKELLGGIDLPIDTAFTTNRLPQHRF